MATPLDVVVVGSYVQDHAWFCERFPADGETLAATGFNTGPGGKGFNQAVAAHRQGVKTAFIGAIGRDTLGGNAERFASEDGLPCEWVRCDDTPTAASSILVNGRGENRIVVSLGANLKLDAGALQSHRRWFDGAKVVLTQLETDLEGSRAALSFAREVGALAMLNPAPIHPRLDRALVELADVATPNETEFALMTTRLFGQRVDAEGLHALSDELLHQLCRATGLATVVLTLGARGCFVSHADAIRRGEVDRWYRIAPESVNCVDTTGAGDAFSGGLAAGLILFHYDQPFRRAVEYANRVAAMSTEIVGTAPAMPTRAQVQARFGA